MIKITPDASVEEDSYARFVLSSQAEIEKFSPIPPGVSMTIPGGTMISNLQLYKDNPKGKLYETPVGEFNGLLIFGNEEQLKDLLSEEKAKRGALDLWNKKVNGLDLDAGSFFEQLVMTFLKFQYMIKRKSFLERRIHRYLHKHADKLLPSHEKVYFEYELRLNNETRVADFILKMEDLQPALLIELENPTKVLIKKNGEMTADGMHARNQIMDWVRFVEGNPDNTKREMNFLQGNKRRLVIMGNSNGNIEALKNSSIYSDTVFWTYDVLLEEAKKRWNKILEEQCKLLAIKMEKKL